MDGRVVEIVFERGNFQNGAFGFVAVNNPKSIERYSVVINFTLAPSSRSKIRLRRSMSADEPEKVIWMGAWSR